MTTSLDERISLIMEQFNGAVKINEECIHIASAGGYSQRVIANSYTVTLEVDGSVLEHTGHSVKDALQQAIDESKTVAAYVVCIDICSQKEEEYKVKKINQPLRRKIKIRKSNEVDHHGDS